MVLLAVILRVHILKQGLLDYTLPVTSLLTKYKHYQVKPPYIPPLSSDDDLANFDSIFTEETVQLTPDDPEELARIDQSEFDGFEYINPLLLNKEEAV